MRSNPFQDRKTSSLLHRVRQDISHLREDLGSLLTHTTHRTLPRGARELAEQARSGARDIADHARSGALDLAGQAKSQLAAGGAYALSRVRDFRGQPRCQSTQWVGGAVVVGLLAYGAYAIYRQSCKPTSSADDNLDETAEV
jgi:hypothetical protein